MIITPTIIDVTFYSDGFPSEDWSQLIPRTNLVSNIEDAIQKNNLIFIEGDEDAGKTVLLGLFVKKHLENTISVFFNPLNNLDYEIDYFYTNVVLQIHHYLGQSIPEENHHLIGKEQYTQSLYQLRKWQKKKRYKFNLVIDGLESKVLEDKKFIADIFSILPFGHDLFNIIITGNRDQFVATYQKLKGEEYKIISVSGFADSEALEYLELKEVSQNVVQDIYKVTKGYPGRLRTLKRVVKTDGYSIDQISTSTTYNAWVELDCETVDLAAPTTNVILSLLSLTDRGYSKEEIAEICRIAMETVLSVVEQNAILEHSDKKITIVSNAHKRYFANLLRGSKDNINELLIDFYSKTDDVNSLLELPRLYTGKKEWDKVIKLVDDQYLTKILDRTGSLKSVGETLVLGVQAAEKANRYSDLLRYSIQGSITNELDNYHFWESEIEARISIGDYVGAISLAESAVVLVDRLSLLALIARRQKEFTEKIDETLIQLIQELYNLIDLSSTGEKIYDIVAHLIYALPNLAIEMIEKSSGGVPSKSINDWVVAKLSIAAIDSSSKDNDKKDPERKIQAIESLNNPSVKKINRAISFLVGNYSEADVIREVENISESAEKLKLLRLWLANGKGTNRSVEKVIGLALEELVNSSSEVPITIEVLSELSRKLAYIKNSVNKQALYKKFKLIEKDLLQLGVAKERYSYQLNMFHVEFQSDIRIGINNLKRIINEIGDEKDILIKLESYSEVYLKLWQINDNRFEKDIRFIAERLSGVSKSLFNATALHFKLANDYLRVIGKVDPVLALKIIENINTVDSREAAREIVLESYLNKNLKYVEIDLIKRIEDACERSISRELLWRDVLERYSEAKSLHFNVILLLIYFTDKIKLMTNKNVQVISSAYAYKIIIKNDEWKKKLSTKFENVIFNNWKDSEADWDKIDQGFHLCYLLSQVNQSFSKKIFSETDKLKQTSWLDSRVVAGAYLFSIDLIIRAYKGLLLSNSETSSDYQILEDLIARVPSEIEKLRLWAAVGFSALAAQKDSIFKRVVNDHIILIAHDLNLKEINMVTVTEPFSLIYLLDQDLALKYIRKLPEDEQAQVFYDICQYYVSKRSPFEVYDAEGPKYNCNFIDLSSAIHVLNYVNNDQEIYTLIKLICGAISKGDGLAKPQITTLCDSLNEIIAGKLPDKRNIKHDGFKLISEVVLSTAYKQSMDINVLWLNFIRRSNSIPNLSDAIFVKSIILDVAPFDRIVNGQIEKKKVYDSITTGLDSLPAHYEFVTRVIDISDTMYKIDKISWKKFVSRAFTLCENLNDGSDQYASQKRIIDSMYRLDSAYARELIKQVDADTERNKIHNLLRRHYESLEMANKIKNNKTLEERDKENSKSMVSSVFMALRSLNSDKISSKKIGEISGYLIVGNKLKFHEVYPIYVFYLSNCAKTYRSVKDGGLENLQRDNFREAVKSSNLIHILSQRKKNSQKSYRKFFIDEEFTTNKAIKPKSREKAFSFIKSWLADQAEDFLIIADPYFKMQDLEILKMIKEVNPRLEIDILGCVDFDFLDCERKYKEYWKILSDEDPPFTNITFCRTPSHATLLHDRWIITRNSGLRLGTSINSLGVGKESEISVMKANEAQKIHEETLNEYLTRRKKEFSNQRVSYNGFTL